MHGNYGARVEDDRVKLMLNANLLHLTQGAIECHMFIDAADARILAYALVAAAEKLEEKRHVNRG